MHFFDQFDSSSRTSFGVATIVLLATFGGISCGNPTHRDPKEPLVVKTNSPSVAKISTPPVGSIALPAAPTCDLATTRNEPIKLSLITSMADYVVVVREGGCVETWNVQQKKQTAATYIDPKRNSNDSGTITAYVQFDSIVVIGPSAFDVQSLKPAEMPKVPEEPEPKVKIKDSAMAIRDLEPALAKSLLKWAPKMNIIVTTEGKYTWITPKQNDFGDPPSIQISDDGKLLVSDARLVRLDTGKMRDYVPWTNGFTAMTDEEFPATISIIFGPRSDRVVVLSTARMGAGTNISSARLEDTKTMKTMANLADSCEDAYVRWSPKGTWILRQPCDHGVLANEDEAT